MRLLFALQGDVSGGLYSACGGTLERRWSRQVACATWAAPIRLRRNRMAIAIVAVVGSVFYVLIWMTCSLVTVRKLRIKNDDDVAKATFLEILNGAKKRLRVRDDGDRSSSLYWDDDIAEQVRSRLQDNKNLAIRVLFNYREEGNKLAALQAEAEFQGRDRLDVRYLLPEQRPFKEVHGKIADNGRHGCLSAHEEGERERDVEKFDCSQSWLGRQFAFRRYIADFERQFQSATK